MEEHRVEASPRLKARCAGIFQLLEGAAAVFGQIYLLGIFVVTRDPAATATNILANESLFQIGFASSLIAVGFHLARTLFIYRDLAWFRGYLRGGRCRASGFANS
jgi:hypothetical protein